MEHHSIDGVALPDWVKRNRETMPDAAAPHAFDLAERSAKHNPRWEGAVANNGYWSTGAPLGNGDFGALIYGAPDNLTCLLGKNDLWLRASQRSHFPGENYAEMYRLYKEGDREGFARLLPQDPNWADDFRPSTNINGGHFRLHLAEAASTDKFTGELSLFDATWRAKFQTLGLDNMWPGDDEFELMSFVSAPDEVMVLRVRRQRLPLRSFTWRLNREQHQLLPTATIGAEGGLVWLEQELLQGDRYAIALLQTGVAGDVTLSKRSILGECDGNDGGEAIFYLAMATQRDSDNPLELARRRVTEAAAKGVESLHAAHSEYWRAQWERSWVECADEKVERSWYVSNYLSGTTLRPGKVSPGLQGMWIKENFPAWSADFHGNVNIQAVYQGIMSSNRLELFEPYDALYHGMLPQCRKDTQEYFATEGARLPHAGTIEGFEIAEHNWIPLAISLGPSAWIARLFWWAYQYTLDREFLRDSAYPLLKDVALHYYGLLQVSGKGADGRYLVEPSIFSEHNATGFDGWGTDSIYDIVNMRMAFQQAADAAQLLGSDDKLVATWRETLRDLPALPADGSEVWLYFPSHHSNGRVQAGSWCYPIFPGEVASIFHGTPEERLQANATWKYARELVSSPWCGGCPTVAAALMGDGEWALQSAGMLSNNGLSGGATGSIMQAEHGTGMSLAFNSMVLLGVEGTLVLVPGIPAKTDAAFHSLRAPGAVLVSAEQRGGQVVYAAFQSLHGGTMRVLNPYDPLALQCPLAKIQVRRLDTRTVVAQHELPWRAPVEWEAEAGVVYLLELQA